MFSTILVWLIWLFLFIPVLAWVLGLVLPTAQKTEPPASPIAGIPTTGTPPASGTAAGTSKG